MERSGPPAAPPTGHDDTIHGGVERQAAVTPDACAVCDGDREIGYAEFNEMADRVAAGLRARGVTAEETVAVSLAKSAELVVVLLGILKAGAAYMPLDRGGAASRTRLASIGAGVRRVVTTAGEPAGIDAEPVSPADLLAGPIPSTDLMTAPPAARPHGRRLAYVLHTSGSTGVPKGVMIEHRSVVNLARNAGYLAAPPDRRDMRILLNSTPTFDAATFELWTPLLNGGCLVIGSDEPLAPGEYADLLGRRRVGGLLLIAPMFHLLAETKPEMFGGLGLLLVGGDVVRPEAVREVLARHPGLAVAHIYGPTEATCISCFEIFRDPARVPDPLPLGEPVAGCGLSVRDQGGKPVREGVGELWIGGIGVARGYRGMPGLTAERFVPDESGDRHYRTGDLVRLRAPGTLEFVGRIDRQVKIRGVRIEPDEVETALRRLPGVRDALVRPVEFPGAGRELVAYLVAREGRRPPGFAELSRLAAAGLPRILCPVGYVVLDALPLTPTGKIDESRLPAPRRGAVVAGPVEEGSRT